jgi:hypothetical protein
MANQSEKGLVGVIEIPIITSRTGPMKSLLRDLTDMAWELDRARNAMMRAAIGWRDDHPEWKPEVRLKKNGAPFDAGKFDFVPNTVAPDGSPGQWQDVVVKGKFKKSKGGVPSTEPREEFRRIGDNVKGMTFKNWLYHQGTRVSQRVSPSLISLAAEEVLSNLKTDVQRHGNGHKFRWQAVLAYDEQLPCFRARNILVPTQRAVFCYAGNSTGKGPKEDAAFWGKSSAVLLFNLFSKDTGRKVLNPIVTLNVGALSPGNRRVLAKVARGEWTFSNSRLVFKKGRWIFQMTYRRPDQDLGLDKSRVATLLPQFPNEQNPFLLRSMDVNSRTGKFFFWRCGHGQWLEASQRHYDARAKRLRSDYRTGSSGRKGHGVKREELRHRGFAPRMRGLQRAFTWRLIADVVRFCMKNDCGSVVYYEPSLPMREHLWLGDRGVAFDFTGFATDLKFKLKQFGIDCEIPRIGGHELRERLGADGPKPPKEPQPVHANGHTTNGTNGAARKPESKQGEEVTAGKKQPSRFDGRKRW